LLFLRGFRCTTKCGWRGFRFSRSQFQRHKRQLRATFVTLLLILLAAATVHFVLSRVGTGARAIQDEGIQEAE
jgi:hypothetical protein